MASLLFAAVITLVLVMVIFAVLCKVGWAYLLCSKSGKSSKVLTK